MAFGFRKGRGKAGTSAVPEQAAPAPGSMAQLISQEISLQPEREAILKEGMDDGLEFYNGISWEINWAIDPGAGKHFRRQF